MKIKSVDVINKILFSLKENPKTLSQIANSSSIHWDSAKNYLSQLEEMNIIYKEIINSKEYYILHPNPKSQKNYNTYFNIPISKEIKEKLESFYALIQHEFKQITQKEPSTTQMYKILAKLDKEQQLNLPLCWYSYGLISPLIYNKEQQYEQKVFIETPIKDEIISIIREYSQFTFTRKLLIEQYKEFNNQLYIKKEEFLTQIYTNKSFNNIKNSFLEFIDECNNSQISKTTTKYYNIYYTLLLYSKELLFNNIEVTENSIELYKKLFKLVALQQFEESVLKHKLLNQEVLNYIIQSEYNKQIEIIEEEIELFKEFLTEKLQTNIILTPKDFTRGREEDVMSEIEQEELLKSLNLN